ncbi:helix-turn-helix domain-containing protein [Saxibacter everestensis]|uniref:Helix-turn-helix domain-containing protein n=1 Tax=Saxibacter everestensis TaxID=2909229 RepID=A0ABY8QUR9_9MICO|nr:helix-turn-helix domain-containing protein [Brevibacteriaceae bacterium ZFBP1038]
MGNLTHSASSTRESGLIAAFDVLGKKWNGIILAALSQGPIKFSDLRRSVGSITDSVLSDRLVDLIAAGLVERTETGVRPSHITYALSQQGQAIQPILDRLATWAATNLQAPGHG